MTTLRDTFLTAYKNKPYPNYWDLIALFFVLSLILFIAWNAKQMSVPYHLGQTIAISLDPIYLPGYALRTVSRMLIALIFSLLFTFTVFAFTSIAISPALIADCPWKCFLLMIAARRILNSGR